MREGGRGNVISEKGGIEFIEMEYRMKYFGGYFLGEKLIYSNVLKISEIF